MPSLPRRSLPRFRNAAVLAAAALAVTGVLSGCTEASPGATSDPSSGNAPTSAPATPEKKPKLRPDGSAEDNLPFFAESLREFSASSLPVEGRPIVEALAEAGFDMKRMQVSFDRTRTGLVADSIFVSVRIGEDCLIGQVLTSDRRVFTEASAAVGPERKLCLIGQTRPIDW